MKDGFRKIAGRFLSELKENFGKAANRPAAADNSPVVLTSLAGAPNTVGGGFDAGINQLTSLKSASDVAAEEIALREAVAQAVEANTVLQRRICVSKPLSLRAAA